MPDILENERPRGNGGGRPGVTARWGVGLDNTNPVATSGSILGSGTPFVVSGEPGRGKSQGAQKNLQSTAGIEFEVHEDGSASLFYGGQEHVVTATNLAVSSRFLWTPVAGYNLPAATALAVLRPGGPVVLFQKIMEDWGFHDREAAILLGFAAASDIREIYLGMRSVRQRDANDRLRAVLRIATDLDALFGEVAAIRDWLSEPQHDLDGATPRALLTEGSMENLLRVKYYVAYLSGR